MRKKILLALLCTVGMMGAFAQTTTTTVEPTNEATVQAPLGNDVRFNFTDFLALGTFTLECTSVPSGATNTFTEEDKTVISLLAIDLLGAFEEITPTVAGDYEFTLKQRGGNVISGYTYTDLMSFTLEMTDTTLSSESVESSPEFSVTYNAGVLSIKNVNESEVTGVSVLSISGATVYTSNTAKDSIDISSLANGMYILVVQEGGASITRKFIKN